MRLSNIVKATLILPISALDIRVWDDKNCRGATAFRSLYVIEADGCHVRGEMERNGMKERALTAESNNLASQSEIVAFFTSDDCNPDNVIQDAWLSDGCSSSLETKVNDIYQSWAVWDMCQGNVGCNLE